MKEIDNYINSFDDEIKERLVKIRQTIRKVNPDMIEKISWGMPTFWLKYNIIHFAVSKNHIGIYPGSAAVEYFREKLKEYKTSKGAIQLPHSEEIPYNLIKEIVEYNLQTLI